MRFCVKCGAPIRGGVLCVLCGPKDAPAKLRVTICAVCGRWLSKARWMPARPLAEVIGGLLGVKAAALPPLSGRDRIVVERPPAVVEVKRGQCGLCARGHTDYFEGVLQLRGARAETLEEVREFLQAYIAAHADRSLWVTKSVPRKDGVDLYLVSRRGVSELASRLQARFGGALSQSPKLFSKNRQTSKAVYRLNALLVLPAVRVGDFVRTEQGVARVTRLGKPLKATLVESGKRLNLVRAGDVLPARQTTVASLRPFTVLHPDTFQAEPVRNPPPPGTLRVGEAINVVVDRGLVRV